MTPGNPGNAGGGRTKNAIRAKWLRGCDTEFLIDVAHGKAVIKSEDGKKREPTYDERKGAIETCLRYGLGVSDQTEHSGQVTKTYVGFDLSEVAGGVPDDRLPPISSSGRGPEPVEIKRA